MQAANYNYSLPESSQGANRLNAASSRFSGTPPIPPAGIHPYNYSPEDYSAYIPTPVMEYSAARASQRTFSEIVLDRKSCKRKREDSDHCVNGDNNNNNRAKFRKTMTQVRPPVPTSSTQVAVPVQRTAPSKPTANDREKRRRQDLNDAFEELQKKIPALAKDKLTKDNTLRLAVMYIDFLKGKIFEKKVFDEEPNQSQPTLPMRSQTKRRNLLRRGDYSFEFGMWRAEKNCIDVL